VSTIVTTLAARGRDDPQLVTGSESHCFGIGDHSHCPALTTSPRGFLCSPRGLLCEHAHGTLQGAAIQSDSENGGGVAESFRCGWRRASGTAPSIRSLSWKLCHIS
jgi:hypothetical protein